MVAYLEFSDTVSDAFHKPGTVRHRDTAIRHTIGRAHNSQIMEVERTALAAPDCPRSWCSRILQFHPFNPVQAASRSYDDG